jgi:hypothetical protein
MVPLLLVLLLALILFGAGFALKALWWIAVIVLVVWLLGFVARTTPAGGKRGALLPLVTTVSPARRRGLSRPSGARMRAAADGS